MNPSSFFEKMQSLAARAVGARNLVNQFVVLATSLAVLILQPCLVSAQQTGLPVPRLVSISPASVPPGSSVVITLAGQDLDDPERLLLSEAAVKAEPIVKALPPAKKGAKTPAPAALAYKLEVPPNTRAGLIDVRLVNKWGVSNPVSIRVTETPEVSEQEPNNDADEAQRIDLNVAVNGTISTKTDVDYFVFSGSKGQSIVVTCLTASHGSPLDVVAALFDGSGKRLGVSYQYRGSEAVLSYRVPADGDYVVRVNSFGYLTGSAAHKYQLTVSTGPWIDAIFPPMVEPGRKTKVTVLGRNLPGGQLDPAEKLNGRSLEKIEAFITVDTAPELCAGPVKLLPTVFMPADQEWIEYAIRGATGNSNPFILGLARAPVVLERGDNNLPAMAQEITLPCEIAGRIEKRRDRDWFTFTAKKGDAWDIDALGDRIGSPIDLFLVLRDAKTEKVLAQLDDKAPSMDPPRFRFIVPEDGTYQLMIGSHTSETHFGPQHFYRVSIRRENPGFKVQAVSQPGAGVIPRGGSNSIPILVTRLGDWNGEIKLTATDLPTGVSCPPQIVGPGIKQVLLVLTAAQDAKTWTGGIKIHATANIDGKPVTEVVHGASTGVGFARGHVIAIRDSLPFNLTANNDNIVASQGDKISLKLVANKLWPDLNSTVQVSSLSLPTGITMTGKTAAMPFTGDKASCEVTLVCKGDMLPGTYTLLLQGLTQTSFARSPTSKQAKIAIKLPTAPITVTIRPSKVATVSVTPASSILKLGKETELIVKVKRLYEYDGAFRVHLAIPDSVKGLTATEAIIPAGADQAKLILKAAPTATTGPRPGLVVRVTADLPNNLRLAHEQKLAVSVMK